MTCKYNNWVRPSVYQGKDPPFTSYLDCHIASSNTSSGMYNMITRNLETELIPACKRYGLDIVVYNPIAGGLFSGKIKSADMTPAEGRFSDVATAGKMYRGR